MKTERLSHLAIVMRGVKPADYNQGTWFDGEVDTIRANSQEDPLVANSIIPEGFCGTAACVLGHAAVDPTFRKEGLFVRLWSPHEESNVGRQDIIYIDPESDESDDGFGPVEFEDYEAGMEFFGLTETQASALFGAAQSDWRCYSGEGDYIREKSDYLPDGFYTYFTDEPGESVKPKHVARALEAVVDTQGEVIKDYRDETLQPYWTVSQ